MHSLRKMKKKHYLIAAMLSTLAHTQALAGPSTEALTNFLADNTTGKERKELAQWVFVSMAAHPEIRPLSNVSDATRQVADQNMARIATKLITESCIKETKTAINTDGNAALEQAFGALGKLAMQELTSNPAVTASFSGYIRYMDKSKFEAALLSK